MSLTITFNLNKLNEKTLECLVDYCVLNNKFNEFMEIFNKFPDKVSKFVANNFNSYDNIYHKVCYKYKDLYSLYGKIHFLSLDEFRDCCKNFKNEDDEVERTIVQLIRDDFHFDYFNIIINLEHNPIFVITKYGNIFHEIYEKYTRHYLNKFSLNELIEMMIKNNKNEYIELIQKFY